MANFVRNVWKISKIPKDKLAYIVNKLTRCYPDSRLDVNDKIIDFDLIIPEPQFKQDCSKEYIRTGCSHVQEVEGRPWFNWFTWREKFWGVKWNASDGYTEQGETWIRMVFNTPWSFPEPIAEKIIELAKKEGLDLDLRYADEDWGMNCGRVTYCSHTDECTKYFRYDLADNPEQWAKRLWDKY